MGQTLNRTYAAHSTASANATKVKTAKTTESTTRRLAKVSVPKSKPLSARDCGMKKPAQKGLRRIKRWQSFP